MEKWGQALKCKYAIESCGKGFGTAGVRGVFNFNKLSNSGYGHVWCKQGYVFKVHLEFQTDNEKAREEASWTMRTVGLVSQAG